MITRPHVLGAAIWSVMPARAISILARAVFLGWASGLLACGSAAGPEAEGDRRASGTRAMAARLEALARDADPLEHNWMNAARAERLRAMLDASIDPKDFQDLQPRYAIELLNAGRTDDALAAFAELERFMDASPAAFGPLHHAVLRHNLTIAWLRLGEQENCQMHHTVESCLMPITGGGVHTRQRGGRAAMKVLLQQLESFPDDLEARWLLTVASMIVGEYPDGVPSRWLIPPRVFASDHDIGRFPEIAGSLGLDVDDLAGGVAIEDFDADGDLDLMMSSTALRGPLRYFVNDADGSFREATEEAGLAGIVGGLNINHADYDNDGRPDVLVLRGGWLGKAGRLPNSLLRNLGGGRFEDVTEAAGLLSLHPTQTAAWLDYDGDGRLDLYVGNETGPGEPHPSELFHNDGDGTFTECAARAGVTADGFVKAVAAGDYDNDGRPDLYVSRRGEPNLLYHNGGPGPGGAADACGWHFTDVAGAAGVTEPIHSFPAWFFDYDNDGWLDLFVAGYRASNVGNFAADALGLPHPAERARLYRNRGDGTFADVSRAARLDRLLHAMGSNYGDLDNDGWLDFYLGTGDPNLGTLVPNRMFRNAGGSFFQDVTTSGGFGHLQKGHGVAFADLDNDGDQDVYEVMGGVYEGDHYRNVLYENPGHGHHVVGLRLEGVRTNRAAFGARLTVEVEDENGGTRVVHRVVGTGGSFGSSPLGQEVGLGRARGIRKVTVFWPATGATQTFAGLETDRFYVLREGAEAARPVDVRRFRLGRTAGAPPPAS